MPIKKRVEIRFNFYDQLFRNRMRKLMWREILQEANEFLSREFGPQAVISKSTFFADIKAMETIYGAEFEKKNGRVYHYWYKEKDFSIRNIPVLENDIRHLKATQQLCSMVLKMPSIAEADKVIAKLERKYNHEVKVEEPEIEFESAGDLQTMTILNQIYFARQEKKVLKLMYNPLNSEDSYVWRIHPYYLKQYKSQWYVLAYVEERKDLRVLALDRMCNVTRCDYLYRENKELNGRDYFKDVIGVTVLPNEPVQDIDLVFAAVEAKYVKRKLHHSQTTVTEYPNGNLHIRLRLRINPELKMLIHSYAGKVTVLAPQRLADEINRALDKEIVRYE